MPRPRTVSMSSLRHCFPRHYFLRNCSRLSAHYQEQSAAKRQANNDHGSGDVVAEEAQHFGRHHFARVLLHEHGREHEYEERHEPRPGEEDDAGISFPLLKAHDCEAHDESEDGRDPEDDHWQPFWKGSVACIRGSAARVQSGDVDESHHADRIEKKARDDIEPDAKHSAYHLLTPENTYLPWDETG